MTTTEVQNTILESYGNLPLAFVPNVGQEDHRILFYAQGKGFRCAFTPDQVWMTFYEIDPFPSSFRKAVELESERRMRGITLAWRFLNARSGVTVEGASLETGKINYFRGSDPQKHYTNLPLYREVAFRQIWPGIDVVFQGHEGNFKYDVMLHPGARIEDVRIICEGTDEIRLDDNGNLIIVTPFGTLMDLKPVAYQEMDNVRKLVDCRFVIRSEADGSQSVGFEVTDDYLPAYSLVIDPILAFSTYLGGTDFDQGIGIAVDESGNAYVTGLTLSTDFPVTPGAFSTALNVTTDVFVTKLNPTGTALVYSTYLGGSSNDQGLSIGVDAFGNAYVTGLAQSGDFPTTAGAFQTAFGGSIDAFVTKLNPTGTALVYSTYLGGSEGDLVSGIAVDASGNAYMTGATGSANFPVTPGAFNTTSALGGVFVTKLNPIGTALVYSTYLGDGGGDSIAVDAFGNAYVTGFTRSPDFPVTPGAFDTTLGGTDDAFVTKLNPTGTALVYSTYLGGSGQDFGGAIAVDSSGNAYVTGLTFSADFPVTAGAFDTTFEPTNMAFVAKVNPIGNALVYSTYLGGSDGNNEGNGIAVDSSGNASVIGTTSATDFPVTPDAIQPIFGGEVDAFVTQLNPSGTALVFSTYLGGSGPGVDGGVDIVVDAFGNLYVTGSTESPDFPVTSGAFQTALSGSSDAFVTKISKV